MEKESLYASISAELLTDDQRALLREIDKKFRPGEDKSDMGILYETTGFQVERDEASWRFWENYGDFEKLGTSKLVREDKNEEIVALGANRDFERSKVNLD